MKRYIQILVLVICAMSFGSQSKAQEEGTHYPNLVYHNIFYTHGALYDYKMQLKSFIQNPPDVKEAYHRLADRFANLSSMSTLPILAIINANEDGSIVLNEKDLKAINDFNKVITDSITTLNQYIKDIRVNKDKDFSDLSAFKTTLSKVRKAKQDLEEIMDRGGCTVDESVRERADEND